GRRASTGRTAAAASSSGATTVRGSVSLNSTRLYSTGGPTVLAGRDLAEERRKQVDRDREDDRRVALGRYLGQGLQVAQLQGLRLRADHPRRVGQRLGGLELPAGVDDLGALLALGLGLARHRALHRLGQLDVLDLDGRDLDPPRLGLRVDDLLQP